MDSHKTYIVTDWLRASQGQQLVLIFRTSALTCSSCGNHMTQNLTSVISSACLISTINQIAFKFTLQTPNFSDSDYCIVR
jgi:hypothetical protein